MGAHCRKTQGGIAYHVKAHRKQSGNIERCRESYISKAHGKLEEKKLLDHVLSLGMSKSIFGVELFWATLGPLPGPLGLFWGLPDHSWALLGSSGLF